MNNHTELTMTRLQNQPNSNKNVAVVTGSSSGIGYETSLMLARNGFITYATMRNLKNSGNLQLAATKESLPIRINQLDVNDDLSVKNAMQAVSSETGRIDVLVNNAGYGLNGAFEDLTMDEIKAQYETDVFGLIRTTQAVLPTMRRQKSGTIVNISSGAGRFGFPGGSAYVSTKFAVEGLSESMSYELEPFGIKVVIVEPGVIRTNFVNSVIVAKKSQDPNSPYSQIMQKTATVIEDMMKNGSSSPDLVANVVLNAVTNENPNLRYLAGKDVETWLDGKRNMSDEEFYKMMKQNLMKGIIELDSK
jgi:NAD(P)-dependent dehydrogenase (short-subunit alcohol dehydrogenase family)